MTTTRASSRSALLDAALDEFAEKGYEAATVASIAARAGVTTGALYAHFDGKLDLLVETIGLATPAEYAATLASAYALPAGELAEQLGRSMATPGDRRMLLLLDVIVVARRDPAVASTLRRGFEAYLRSMSKVTEDGIAAGVFDPALTPTDLARLGAAISLGLLVLEALGERPPTARAFVQLTDALLRSHGGDAEADDLPALTRVRSRATAAAHARERLHDAIEEAAAEGHSLRRIGEAAMLSHERVRRILSESR